MPQHELEHCDICKARVGNMNLLFCVKCNISMCQDCSCSKEIYFVPNIDEDPLCNTCAENVEAYYEILKEENLEL